jgi:translation initiation factor 3 subunit H
MLKALNEVNIDTLNVGWYQSSYLGSYFTKDTIIHQLDFQQTIENRSVSLWVSQYLERVRLLKCLQRGDYL